MSKTPKRTSSKTPAKRPRFVDAPRADSESARNLRRMRRFSETYRAAPDLAPLVRELSWTHDLLILSPPVAELHPDAAADFHGHRAESPIARPSGRDGILRRDFK